MKDYTPFILNQYNQKNNPNLLAIHFKKLGVYNKQWDLAKIIVFELMLVMSRKTGNTDFYKQQHMIERDTRLGKYKIRKAIEALEEEGILSINKARGSKHFYSVNYQVIKDDLEMVYDFSKVKDEDVAPMKETLIQFINYHSQTEYYENKPVEIDPSDIPKENTEIVAKEEEE